MKYDRHKQHFSDFQIEQIWHIRLSEPGENTLHRTKSTLFFSICYMEVFKVFLEPNTQSFFDELIYERKNW